MQRQGTPEIFSSEHPAHQAAALLFSAGFLPRAIGLLEAETTSEVECDRQCWLVLFDLYHSAGRREDFERLLLDYAAVFPQFLRPSWGFPPSIASAGTLMLEGVMDRASECLAHIQRHGTGCSTMAIDMSRVERIDFGLVGELAGCLRALHLAGKRVILANISAVNSALLEALGVQQYIAFIRRRDSEGPQRQPRIAAIAEAAA